MKSLGFEYVVNEIIVTVDWIEVNPKIECFERELTEGVLV